MTLSVGEQVLERYVIEALIGVGGMGEVYRARHLTLGMPVAVKAISGDASKELVARFTREAQLLARVRHPNVVSILDVGRTAEGSPCMVMEFLEGEALDGRLERRGVLPWREVRAVAIAVLKGLTAIHAAGIVHRDLKPANVLITRGSPSVVKIVDFGIAQPTSDTAKKFTRTGAVVGTPAYMSPEQLVGGDIDARSDLYALALMLYELATGKLPFGDDPNAALRRLSSAIPAPCAPRPLPALPPEAAQTILSALVIDREQRPSSARAMLALLRGQTRDAFEDAEAEAQASPGGPRRALGTQHVQPGARPGTQAAARGQRVPQAPPRPGTQIAPPVPPVPPLPHAARAGTQVAAQIAPQVSPMPTAVPFAPQGTRLGQPPAAAAPESYAVYDAQPSPQQVYAHAAPQARALIAARIPVSRLAQREEQRALAQLATPGRAYHLGGGMWFAIVPAASEAEAEQSAQRVCAGLQQRYGDTCKLTWAPASASFALTPASLSGAAPLPAEIAQLLDHLLALS